MTSIETSLIWNICNGKRSMKCQTLYHFAIVALGFTMLIGLTVDLTLKQMATMLVLKNSETRTNTQRVNANIESSSAIERNISTYPSSSAIMDSNNRTIVPMKRTGGGGKNEETPSLPNVVIIMTDAQNLRTLGCYRKYMDQLQTELWGPGVTVETPNIDSLAEMGALFTNFYTVFPSCTPSRGTFMTGKYPCDHGAKSNNKPLNDDAITFAQILKEKAEYHTSYMGKVKYNLHSIENTKTWGTTTYDF